MTQSSRYLHLPRQNHQLPWFGVRDREALCFQRKANFSTTLPHFGRLVLAKCAA